MAERTDDAILFEEIDDELRQDQANKLWQAYGKYIVALCIAIILSVGGYQAWSHFTIQARQEAGERFAAAITLAAENKTENSIIELAKIIEDGTDGYKILARFSQARLLVQQKNFTGAVEAYKSLAQDKSLDTLYKDLAIIFGALVELNIPNQDLKTLKEKLESLYEESNPWRFSAKEITVMINQKIGAKLESIKLLNSLKEDQLAPKGIRARAEEMLSAMGK